MKCGIMKARMGQVAILTQNGFVHLLESVTFMELQFNFEKKTGKIKPMHAVGQPPTGICDDGIASDLLCYLKQANIPYSRMHDVGAGEFGDNLFVDVPNLFRNFDADENDPSSYDFTFTDKLFEAMMEYEIEPYFRLGVTIENAHRIKAYRVFPPGDFDKWARVCEHIVRHYNEGWADGYHFGIKYWEIWNEPDNEEDIELNNMWKGTKEQYYDFYAVAAKHLKKCFGDGIKIGGYASTGLYLGYMQTMEKYQGEHEIDHWEERAIYHTEFLRGFLERVRKDNISLDFFSHHSYLSVRRTLQVQKYAESILEEYGLGDVEIHLNEWNTDRTRETRGTSQAAADAAAMMIAMQRTKMSMMCYYDARFGTSVYAGIFNPLTRKPFCTLYSFVAFGELYRLGDEVEVAGEGEGLYAIAATNGEERGVLIANIGEERTVTTNLEEGYTVYLIDFDNHMTPVELDYNCFKLAENQTLYLKK